MNQFLVQSDFITQASREDIQRCAWNDCLLDRVSETFCAAVTSFCQHPSLQYDWLKYIPEEHITDPFWGQLRRKICRSLRSYRVLQTGTGDLKYPENLRWLFPYHYNRDDQPLFEDLYHRKIYLSSHYSGYYNSVKAIGVRPISIDELLERVEPYLKGSKPRICQISPQDDWHTRVSELLESWTKTRLTRVLDLPMVPLLNGTLASTAYQDIYFPEDMEGRLIPVDSDINIVQKSAVENQARRSLFKTIGVMRASPQFVMCQITAKYTRAPSQITLEQSISHIRYLYWNLGKGENVPNRVFLMDQDENPVYEGFSSRDPAKPDAIYDDLYFETDGPYGTLSIAQAMEAHTINQSAGAKLHFLHRSYLDAVAPDMGRWKEWLGHAFQVRYVPRMVNNYTISPLLKTILESHSHILLGVLKTYWSKYETTKTPSLTAEIKKTHVPCENGSVRLDCTYLPLPDLRALLSDVHVNQPFPFLITPSPWKDDVMSNWGFLTKFGVKSGADHSFFKIIVEELQKIEPLGDAKDGYFQLYQNLSDRCSDDSNSLR